MAVATSLLIAAGVSAGINAWNAHKDRQAADKIAAREAETDQMNLHSQDQLTRQYLEFLTGQQSANAARYAGFSQVGNQGLAGLSALKGGNFVPPTVPAGGMDYSKFMPAATDDTSEPVQDATKREMGKPWQIGYDLFHSPGNLFHPWSRRVPVKVTDRNRGFGGQPQQAMVR